MSRYLLTVEQLAAHLDDPEWKVFDCRHDLQNPEYGIQAYAKEHIPGAQFMHLDRDLSGTKTGNNGRHPLPAPEWFAQRLGRAGIGPDTQVVAYDNEGGPFAARLWWMLRWLGHERVAVLDGGWAGWRRAKQPTNGDSPSFPATSFPIRLQPMTVDAGYIEERLHSPAMFLVDARSPERFRGEQETLDPVGGHIPGAVNRFYFDNLDDLGLGFKPAAELRREWLELLAGTDPAKVVHQCGSGVTACHNYLAMEIAGLSGCRIYPGSWSEWCSDSSRPVVAGG